MTLGGLMNEALLEYIDHKLNNEDLGKTCCR